MARSTSFWIVSALVWSAVSGTTSTFAPNLRQFVGQTVHSIAKDEIMIRPAISRASAGIMWVCVSAKNYNPFVLLAILKILLRKLIC